MSRFAEIWYPKLAGDVIEEVLEEIEAGITHGRIGQHSLSLSEPTAPAGG